MQTRDLMVSLTGRRHRQKHVAPHCCSLVTETATMTPTPTTTIDDDDEEEEDTCLGGLREGRGQGRREPWKKPKGWFNHEEDGEEWR